MSKKLTVLFAPMDAVGHVNSCIGLAQVLESRGHRIVFLIKRSDEGLLSKYGFTLEFLDDVKVERKKPGEEVANHLVASGMLSGKSSFEKIKMAVKFPFFMQMIDDMINEEPRVEQTINAYKPDVFIIDSFVGSPTLVYSGKPWILVCSANPLIFIDDERTPPGGSGFPSTGDPNSKEWIEYREAKAKMFEKPSIKYNQYLSEKGFPTVNNKLCIPQSPYFNIYGFPQELDYTDLRPLPDKWFRVDALMRLSEPGHFEIPDKLKIRDKKKQKLIYLSLGSMGSADIQLMKRLVNILSKSEHKFIVSKGLFGDKYELADNMWGQNSVPQTKVLPLVDLVITHGGNNTITETFTFGKPMIVMPLFGDQYDNAQRVQEKGYGIRVEPYSCTEEELLGAVEKLLNDENMRHRLSIASKRMQTSDSLIKATELIEKLV